MEDQEDWTIPKGGKISVPDELVPLFNKVGMQIRFHTISGLNEVLAAAHIVKISQEFFLNNKHLLE
jgi:hypothetical protein